MRLPLTLLLTVALAAPLAAKPPLRDVDEIDNGLMSIAIADEIRKTCEGIDARLLRALATINGLKSRAKDLGYSAAEIDDYVNSQSEKDRMRGKATDFLARQGVAASDTAQLCAFGKSQIAAGTPIGRLLR